MLKIVNKARFAAQVGYLCKGRNAVHSFERLTRRARQRRLLALLCVLRRCPTCAATHVALKAFSGRAEPLNTFSTGC